MHIEFYPYDFEYKVEDGRVLFYIYAKTTANERICIIHPHFPAFFAAADNIKTALFEKKLQALRLPGPQGVARVLAYKLVDKELLGKKQRFYQITANYPKAVPLLAQEIQSWGVICYERDILFVHRYLRDFSLTPMTLWRADGEFITAATSTHGLPTFQAKTVSQKDLQLKNDWRILALDIETYARRKEIDPEKNPILMAALHSVDQAGKEFKKVITWKRFAQAPDFVEFVQDEAALINSIVLHISAYDPDIITGYFSDGFDLPYLRTRADKYNIPLTLGIDGSELRILAKRGMRSAEAKISGRLHIDVLKFIRYIFGLDLKTANYDLNSISAELLGETKHDVDLNTLSDTWDNHHHDGLLKFCQYNAHDAFLTWKLCSTLLPYMMEFTMITGIPTYDVIRMRFSRLVESYIMKRAMEYNALAPNKPSHTEIEQRMDEHIQGAFVFQPTPGLYQDIVVFDFRSLYPSIISAHNIGPEGFRCACCETQEHVPEKEDYWFCQQEKKFLPRVLEDLILRRAALKEKIRQKKKTGEETKALEAQSYALKILANSFYGYLGFFGARWYCLECAASTTAYARDYIHKTITAAQQKGFRVVYSDTDSCFLLLGEQTLDAALAFMKEINKDLPGRMELEFEGYFPRGIFVAIKGKLEGAKKKYALRREDGALKITGFESVRRNWSDIAKEVQEHVLQSILNDNVKVALQYIKDVIKELKGHHIPVQKLILRTQITRDLAQYKSLAPHVLVAQKLAAQGEIIRPGFVVEYVITQGAGLVREKAKLPIDVRQSEYDAEYYLHHQILPAVASIFAVLGYEEEDLIGGGKQHGLGDFF